MKCDQLAKSGVAQKRIPLPIDRQIILNRIKARQRDYRFLRQIKTKVSNTIILSVSNKYSVRDLLFDVINNA